MPSNTDCPQCRSRCRVGYCSNHHREHGFINPDWLKRGFEVSDGLFHFIVIDVHADTVTTFDSEAVVDVQSHEEWADWVRYCLKNGGGVINGPLTERLKEWTEFHPNFPVEQVLPQ